jgi:hypothetical protein
MILVSKLIHNSSTPILPHIYKLFFISILMKLVKWFEIKGIVKFNRLRLFLSQ